MIYPVFDRVGTLLAYYFSVFTSQAECSRSCPLVRENIRIESGLSGVVVEELDCECSAIDGGRPGDQVVDVPNLVDLSSPQNVGLVFERIWLFDCQSGRGTRVDKGHHKGLCYRLRSDCAFDGESVDAGWVFGHVDRLEAVVARDRIKISCCCAIDDRADIGSGTGN